MNIELENSAFNFYRNKRILVTGGASFIGSHLVELLVHFGAKVRVVDDLSSGKLENLENAFKHIEFSIGDLRDPSIALSACQDQDIVFHLAASHGGRGYIETHPTECMNNMLLDHQIFAAAAKSKIQKIVYASSACVYPTNLQDHEDQRNFLSEDSANFEQPGKAFADGEYGWAKLMGEMQLKAFCKQYGLTGIACRIFTAYGERENESHAAIALIAKAVAKMDPFPIWGSGYQTRNFTYVQDTVMGLALAAVVLNGFEVINIGSDTHHTILELCEEIFKVLNWRPKVIEKQLDKPVGVKSRASNNNKIMRLLNWQPVAELSNGIKNTTHWYIKNIKKEQLENLDRLLMERN